MIGMWSFAPWRICGHIVLFGLLALTLQGLGPFRLNVDVVNYVGFAEMIAAGDALDIVSGSSLLPTGYPFVLFLLGEAGLATPFVFVLLNVISIAGALVLFCLIASERVGDRNLVVCGIACLSVLSFITVKHSLLAISDPFYMLLSFAALALAERPRDRHRHRQLIVFLAAGLCLGAAIWVRSIGIALIPALLLAWLAAGSSIDLGRLVRGRLFRIAALPILAAVIFLLWLLRDMTSYDDVILALIHRRIDDSSVTDFLLTHAGWKLSELSEILLNLPASRIPSSVQPLFLIGGALLTLLVARGLWLHRARFGPVEFYLLAYAVTVLLWNHRDARYWFPVLPLLLLYLWIALEDLGKNRVIRGASLTWCGMFAMAGLAAHVYSASQSLAGKDFGHVYGDGTLRQLYLAAYAGAPEDGFPQEHIRMLDMLRRYDPLVHD